MLAPSRNNLIYRARRAQFLCLLCAFAVLLLAIYCWQQERWLLSSICWLLVALNVYVWERNRAIERSLRR